MHRYLEELSALDLPRGDWALFGSGPLLVRGWVDDVGDLDVITRGAAWDKARSVGVIDTLEDGSQIVSIGDGVTVGRGWKYGDLSVDEMIDTAESIDGIPCVGLDHIIAYKLIADRPKDRRHLKIIEQNLGEQQ